MKNNFYILDVFGEKKYSGNQLAVIIAENNLTDSEMQNIAFEFNFSETTFILVNEKSFKGDYKVRIFTPGNEVPFAGHPSLGTAYIIQEKLFKNKSKNVKLDLKAGVIEVSRDYSILWMKQHQPIFGEIHKNTNDIAQIISLEQNVIDSKFPIQNVSTGLEFLIIPLQKLSDIKKATTNLLKYENYFKGKEELPLFLFCPETYDTDNKINARMFASIFGIVEDPATGSASGCLSAYLSKYQYFGSKNIDLRVEQGYEVNRKSLLHLKCSHDDNDNYEIFVGGNVIEIAEGII